MFLAQLLEEYKESEDKQQILNWFLDDLWKSKYKFKKYKRYYKYKVNKNSLDNRQDLIELFNKYSKIEYVACKSFYLNKNLKPIDYIRIHINNMYGYLVDKDVYYNKKYYKLLLTPKKEYFRIINIKKNKGNIDDVNYEEIKQNIENALQEAELIKQKCIAKKHDITFKEYKQIINSFIEKIFNNFISTEEYENKYGWELNISIDGWSEDNYIIKYFCKSLTGYMRNYIKSINSGKYIKCANCNKLIKPTNNRQKYCSYCWKEKERERQKIKWHKYKHKYRSATALENLQTSCK